MRSLIKRFWDDDSGVTAIEYGLITLLIAIPVVSGITATGNATGAMWNLIGSKIN